MPSPPKPEQIPISIELGEHGLYYGTSPAMKGLLVTGHSIQEVMGRVPDAIAEIREIEEASKRLSLATQFTLQRRGNYAGEPTETVMVEWRGGDHWVVTNGLEVLNIHGEWEHEPRPSSRDDEFKARTRLSLDGAFARARAYIDLKEVL